MEFSSIKRALCFCSMLHFCSLSDPFNLLYVLICMGMFPGAVFSADQILWQCRSYEGKIRVVMIEAREVMRLA